MSWHDDCSSINNWIVNYISDTRTLESDGQSIYISTGDITEEEGYIYGDFSHNVPVQGDFDITVNVTIPDLSMATANTWFDLDYYINFDNYIYSTDGSQRRTYFDFSFGKNGLDDNVIYLYGFQTSSQGMTLSLPWTGDLRVTREGTTVTAYIGETSIWTGTNSNNNVAKTTDLEFYIEADGDNYPMDYPCFKINDVNIIGSTISSNAKLSSINIDVLPGSLNPSFSSTTYSYTGQLHYNTEEVVFTVQNLEGTATITINNVSVESNVASSPFAISVGDNTFTIHVIAEDGVTTQDYAVVLNRSSTASNVCTLSNLTGYPSISPTFSTSTLEYSVSFDASRTSFQFTPTLTDALSTLTYNNTTINSGVTQYLTDLPEGITNIEIVVTAENGTDNQTYTITVNRIMPTNNADLSSLVINELGGYSSGYLIPSFNRDILSYKVTFANLSSVNIIPTTRYSNSTIKINGTTASSGQSCAVSLSENLNEIQVEVTSSDLSVVKTYVVDVYNLIFDESGFLTPIMVYDEYLSTHDSFSFHTDNKEIYLESTTITQGDNIKLAHGDLSSSNMVAETSCKITIDVDIPNFDIPEQNQSSNILTISPFIQLFISNGTDIYNHTVGGFWFKLVDDKNCIFCAAETGDYSIELPFSGSLGLGITGDEIYYLVDGNIVGHDSVQGYVYDGTMLGYGTSGLLIETPSNSTFDPALEIPEMKFSNFIFEGSYSLTVTVNCKSSGFPHVMGAGKLIAFRW